MKTIFSMKQTQQRQQQKSKQTPFHMHMQHLPNAHILVRNFSSADNQVSK